MIKKVHCSGQQDWVGYGVWWLMSKHAALSATFEGRYEGDIISEEDVRESPREASEGMSRFRVDEVLD